MTWKDGGSWGDMERWTWKDGCGHGVTCKDGGSLLE